MEFSRDWLGQYVKLPTSDQGTAEWTRQLTNAGLAVEGERSVGSDVVVDIDITTNRPDCMNHFGLARELAVIRGVELKDPETDAPESGAPADEVISVHLEAGADCPRYVGRVLRDVEVRESPDWLKKHLEALGLRPINNIVDVTNYVLWETGQPLHAFDLEKIEGGEIHVRPAREGETLTTLDGEERELSTDDLVIADAEKPVALAGVMGGLDSEVTSKTRTVLLESAHFDRTRVRKTARRLGMKSDASHRFERGVDPQGCRFAADRAFRLLSQMDAGKPAPGAVDARQDLPRAPVGRLELKKLQDFAGVEIDAREVERILTGLGFELHPDGHGAWRVRVPSWRMFDFDPRPEPPHETYPADFYEEILRIHGFDRVPPTLPRVAGHDGPPTLVQRRRALVQDMLSAAGYAETINFAFYGRDDDAGFPSLLSDGTEPTPLENPLSERYDVMRRTLVPGLLASALFNLRRGADATRLFEVGHVFGELPSGAEAEAGETTEEHETFALLCGGRVGNPWDRTVELDLFDLKGALEAVVEAARPDARLEARSADLRGVVPGTGATLWLEGQAVGHLGQLDTREIETPLYAAEMRLDALAGESDGDQDREVTVPSRFPGVAADLTLTHPVAVSWSEIADAVGDWARGVDDLQGFGLKDRYKGRGVPEGAVNTTMSFFYGSEERSLSQDEVNRRQQELAERLEARFGLSSEGSKG